MGDQIDYMLRVFLQARAAEQNQTAATSTNSIKNQVLASNLIKTRKSHGLNKSVAQGFLKRIVTPYGALNKFSRPRLMPIKMMPSVNHASRFSSLMEDVSGNLGEDSILLGTEESEVLVAPEQISKILSNEMRKSVGGYRNVVERNDTALLVHETQELERQRLTAEKVGGAARAKEATKGGAEQPLNSFHTNVSIHDCVYQADSVASRASAQDQKQHLVTAESPATVTPSQQGVLAAAGEKLLALAGLDIKPGEDSILTMQGEAAKQLEQGSIITADDGATPNESTREKDQEDGEATATEKTQ